MQIELRELCVEDWTAFRALRLAALADSPAAFGAKLTDWQGTHDSEARWRARLQAVPFNVIANLDGRAVGMASGTRVVHESVELLSMWIAPSARGKTIGDRLVQAVCVWSARHACPRVTLRVYKSNTHAAALYQRNGFSRSELIKARSAGAEDEWSMVRLGLS